LVRVTRTYPTRDGALAGSLKYPGPVEARTGTRNGEARRGGRAAAPGGEPAAAGTRRFGGDGVAAAAPAAARRPAWLALLVASRPRQWIKNLLVLAVPAAAGALGDAEVIRDTALALVAFCLASAGTYLLNDVADRDADRAHPVKRLRPIAAGEVGPGTATAAAVVALLAAVAVAAAAEPALAGVVGAYVVLTTAYSRRLKHVPIFDIAVVAAGFFLRAVAGGVAADLYISKWFLILAGGGSLFLVTAKRYAELREAGGAATARRVLAEYSEDYLRAMLATTAGVVVVAYCIWCFEERGGHAQTWVTSASAVPFVLGIMRYGLLVDQGHGEEPEQVLLGDATLLALAAAWLALLVLGSAW
jgi:decaprenyl-phosphate phosphoribosyltransferase